MKLRDEIMELIISTNRLGFRNKRDIIESIIKDNYPDISKKYPTLFTDIRFISDERNIFAHATLDTTNEGMSAFKKTGVIRFVQVSKNPQKRIIPYNQEDIDKIIDTSNNCIKTFREILELDNPPGIEL